MAQLQNQSEVNSWLAPKLQIIVEEILEGIEKLNREKIDEIVYAAYNPTEYLRMPEGENFASAWDSKNIRNFATINGCKAEGEFAYEPKNMGLNPDEYQHGNSYSSNLEDADVRDKLAYLIYEGASGSWFGDFGPWMEKRDAWTALNKAIGKTRMRKWIKNGARKAGLKIKFK